MSLTPEQMQQAIEYRRLLESSKEAREMEIIRCASDPGYMLWNPQHYVKTFDSYEDGPQKVKPFPYKAYMYYVLWHIHNDKVLFIPKSRQIMATWLVCFYLWWDARFHPFELNFAQSKKEEDAANLVYNKDPLAARISFMEAMLPDWMRDEKATYSYGIINFSNSSKIWGIPQGGDIIRSYTPSVVFLDEAAFQPEAEKSYSAAKAAARKIIAISSAELSWFGLTCGLQKTNRATQDKLEDAAAS
jgi:hypothetical protein